MQAFHNDEKIKTKYLNRVLEHQKADEIIKGQYWKDSKGCAVACTIHDSDHSKYEKELGIPEWLAKLEDALFEGVSVERSKTLPYEFLNAIKPGVDLEKVKKPFVIYILEQNLITLRGLKVDKKHKDVIDAIADSISTTEQ